jgi:hypothetical protein
MSNIKMANMERGDFMRKQFVEKLAKISLLSVVAMFMAVGSARAQSLANRLTVNIPFDFTVVDKKLPAGEYSVGRAQTFAGDVVLSVDGVNHDAHVLSLTSSAQSLDPKPAAILIFHRYGDQYFLYEVWPKGATSGRAIAKSRAEREVEQKARQSIGAAKRKAVETVAVVVGLN